MTVSAAELLLGLENVRKNPENFLRDLGFGAGGGSGGIQTGAHEEGVVVVAHRPGCLGRIGQVLLVLPGLGDPVALGGKLGCCHLV